MTDAEITKLCEEATKGPWVAVEERDVVMSAPGSHVIGSAWHDGPCILICEGDQAFIAAARDLVPDLLKRAQAAERLQAGLSAANRHYADDLQDARSHLAHARGTIEGMERAAVVTKAQYEAEAARLRGLIGIEARPPGCVCTWEAGDSLCPAHTCAECGCVTCECHPQEIAMNETPTCPRCNRPTGTADGQCDRDAAHASLAAEPSRLRGEIEAEQERFIAAAKSCDQAAKAQRTSP